MMVRRLIHELESPIRSLSQASCSYFLCSITVAEMTLKGKTVILHNQVSTNSAASGNQR